MLVFKNMNKKINKKYVKELMKIGKLDEISLAKQLKWSRGQVADLFEKDNSVSAEDLITLANFFNTAPNNLLLPLEDQTNYKEEFVDEATKTPMKESDVDEDIASVEPENSEEDSVKVQGILKDDFNDNPSEDEKNDENSTENIDDGLEIPFQNIKEIQESEETVHGDDEEVSEGDEVDVEENEEVSEDAIPASFKNDTKEDENFDDEEDEEDEPDKYDVILAGILGFAGVGIVVVILFVLALILGFI